MKLLKQKILDLAIRGRLVPQEAGSGQLSVTGGQCAVVGGAPFEIPVTWKWVRLGEVGNWRAGATPSRSRKDYFDGTIPWLKTGDLNDNLVTEIPENITETAHEETSVHLNPVGSVLIAMYGATIGKLGILGIPATTNQACCACIPNETIDNRYLFYFLLAWRQNFIKMGSGGAQPNISKEKIVNTLFPLPPLDEQQRIVEKVEELFREADAIEKAKEKLAETGDRLRRKLLDMAVSGRLSVASGQLSVVSGQCAVGSGRLAVDAPFEIPVTWKWVRLGEISSYGKPMPKIKAADISSDTWSLDLEDIEKGTGRIIAFCKAGDREIRGDKVKFGKGQILYSKLRPYLKKNLVAPDDGVCTSEIVPFDVFENADAKYVLMVLTSSYVDEKINAVSYGVKMPRVGKETMINLPIPLPPLAEQRAIVEKLEALLPLVEKLG